jgi:hypothetical protein
LSRRFPARFPALNLDIYHDASKTIQGGLSNARQQFKQANVYQDFEIQFDAPARANLEFRTWYYGVCAVNQESVIVRAEK